jgi:ElaB/YqjD/DUF883 family membrane-anchored ribosome-binding protein
MNNTYQSKWNEIRSEVLKTWGTLKKEDLDNARENSQKLVESIQQKLGKTQDDVEMKVDRILKKFDIPSNEKFNTSKSQKH